MAEERKKRKREEVGESPVGKWIRRNGALAHITGRTVRGDYTKQWFEPGRCPNRCLEGDGGTGGPILDSDEFVDPPEEKWCNICEETAFFDKEVVR